MKAKLTDRRFSDPEWIFERKLDGVRCLAYRGDGPVRLESRNRLSLNGRYPGVVAALEAQAATGFVLDGEVVASSFQALQGAARDPKVKVDFFVFDAVFLGEEDLRGLPVLARKRKLKAALKFSGPIRWTPYRRERGEELYAEACAKGWEGLIAKRIDSTYSGARSGDWLKFKCSGQQEVVIGGFTAPKGSRARFGALLVGVYDGAALRYAGKVGTGFDGRELEALHARMTPLVADAPPFADAPRLRDATWIAPELVCEVGFQEWTRDGKLRHPRYLGLRDDKRPREVIRERPS